MAIKKMHFYTMSFPATYCFEIVKKVGELPIFPQLASKIVQNVKGVSVYQLENPYLSLLEEVESLMETLNIEKIANHSFHNFSLEKAEDFIQEVKQPVEKMNLVIEQLNAEIEENKEAFYLLQQIEKQDFNIDDLKDNQYIEYRVGKINTSKLDSLKHHIPNNVACIPLSKDKEHAWIIYLCLGKDKLNADNFFKGFAFEEVYLPDFLHGTLQDAYESLHETTMAMEDHLENIVQRKEALRDQYYDHLEELYHYLKYYEDLVEHSNCLVDFGNYVSIYAYSTCSLEELKAISKEVSIIELPISIYEGAHIEAPVILENHWFVRPFENYIVSKGTDSIDMTLIVAMLVSVLSIFCLGDLIIGCFLLIVGILSAKTSIGKMIKYIGLGSCAGGFMHGTIWNNVEMYQGVSRLVVLERGIIYFVLGMLLIKVLGTIFMEIVRKIKRRGSYGNC
ncbi:V-type ATP synthase subunit I domain-containing protein [Tannockella kyphosi]|uniref:hypothetical protein n=1 Tax=Tannockella kyphosi TaxID=2899121 RepID=UPI002012392D|nr:hypothetical protein [Tannockella kyphosi]